jgi:NAD-dependent deacetylase
MYEPEYLLSEECLHHKPKVFFEFYRQKMDARNVKPNITHYMLARLEKLGKLDKIITQNIDGLHQKAGSSNVIELHGSVLRNYCERCHKFYGIDKIINSEGVPMCDCGGRIKPDVVLYEEGLDDNNITNAVNCIRQADMLIIGGTSLGVYPAAGLIDYYRGDKLVLINKSATPYDNRADILINEPLADVFKNFM